MMSPTFLNPMDSGAVTHSSVVISGVDLAEVTTDTLEMLTFTHMRQPVAKGEAPPRAVLSRRKWEMS